MTLLPIRDSIARKTNISRQCYTCTILKSESISPKTLRAYFYFSASVYLLDSKGSILIQEQLATTTSQVEEPVVTGKFVICYFVWFLSKSLNEQNEISLSGTNRKLYICSTYELIIDPVFMKFVFAI